MVGLPMTEGVQERTGLSRNGLVRAHAPARGRLDISATRWRIADSLLGVGILAAMVIAGNLDRGQVPHGLEELLAIPLTLKDALLLTAFGLVWPAVLSACGLYSRAWLRGGTGHWPRLLLAGAIGWVLASGLLLVSVSGRFRPLQALLFATALVLAMSILRSVTRVLHSAGRETSQRQILIVGSGPLAERMYRQLRLDPLQAGEVIGYLDSETHPALGRTGSVHLGGVNDLERILMHRVVDDVFIGLPVKSRYDEIQQCIVACARVGVPASYSAELFGNGFAHSYANDRPEPVLSLSEAPSAERLALKRLIDVIGALLLLLVLAPAMVAIALAIRLTSRGPVVFTQTRYGYMKRLFPMYKFRTMVADAEQIQDQLEDRNEAAGPMFKIRADPRITAVGRFLRRWSLDELPQLWNVLMGTMSLVGPRPMAIRDVGQFTEPWLMRRFSMRPGITCLWQISDRSDLGFDRWIVLDLEYIARWSLWLDLGILVRTIPAVIRGSGAV
jgi:exopolysaccharide biosynthesis polyprenyl glycosylphosphotransferase